MKTASKYVLLCLLAAGFSGCASVNFDYPKDASYVITDTDDTYLGRDIGDLPEEHPGESAFYLLTDGIDALAARLRMADVAEKSIDVQYYLITNDVVGYAVLGVLLEAADRGVRVRLLLDDIQTQGYDAGMAALDSHPNFQVRIFNPFSSRSNRIGDATDFNRVNRRMHNKSFTVDNQVTIVGGRNIAEEYFGARDDVNFGDLDVLGVGPVVDDVSAMFDLYWNHRMALPIPAFAEMPDDPAEELEALRGRIAAAVGTIADTRYAEVVNAEIQDYIRRDESWFFWAPYEVVYDSPDKADKDKAEDAASITVPLGEVVRSAEYELIVVSPYFVPLKSGVEFFQELRDKGVEIIIATNSLAATNHSIVHSGYAPYRKDLLKMGVSLFEVKPNASLEEVKRGGSGANLATLHTKAFLVDRSKFFLGSFNWDPRSARINTELGVIIESPELGQYLGERVYNSIYQQTYKVFLNGKNKIRWVEWVDDEPVIYTKEPKTGFWRRFSANAARILPIRGQL